MKKLALFDVDGVFYDGHIIFDSIQDQEKKGLISKGTWGKILKMLELYKSGKASYNVAADNMLKIYARVLKDQRYSDLVIYTQKLIEENKDKFYPYFTKIVPVMLKNMIFIL